MLRKHSLVWTIMTLAAVLAAGCGQKTTQEASNTPTPSASAPAVSVSQVELGRGVDAEKRITERVETFKPNDVIYASVVTNGASPGSTLKARWTYQDGQVVEETEQAIAPTGPAATEFHISKPDGWPKGKYKVEILLNGSSVQSKDFEVK